MRSKRPLLIPYVVLIVVALGSLLALFLAPDGHEWDWSRSLSANMATNILAVLLVTFLIDRIITRSQDKEREQYRAIALGQLRIPLIHQLHVLFQMFKASVTERPVGNHEKVSELFTDDYFAQLRYLDFGKPAPVYPPVAWLDYIQGEAHKFQQALDRTSDKYALYLDLDTLSLLEELSNSVLLSLLLKLTSVRSAQHQIGYTGAYVLFAAPSWTMHIKEYTSLFTRLVDRYNQYTVSDKRIVIPNELWRDDISPMIGDARFSGKLDLEQTEG